MTVSEDRASREWAVGRKSSNVAVIILTTDISEREWLIHDSQMGAVDWSFTRHVANP